MFDKFGKRPIISQTIIPGFEESRKATQAELRRQIQDLKKYTTEEVPRIVREHKRCMEGLEQLSRTAKGLMGKKF